MSASKFHAVRVRQPLRKPVAPPAGYTQAGGVSSALMVKSDLLASGGRVGGPAGAIQVIPNRFGRSAFAAYGAETTTSAAPTMEFSEIGPGDKGDVVKEAARLVKVRISQIDPNAYQLFDMGRKNFNDIPQKGPLNMVNVGHITDAFTSGVYSPEFSLQVGIIQKYMNEKENNKAVGVTGEVDEATWRALGLGNAFAVKKKPKPVSTGGGGGAKTPVKGQGDATPPATPLWQKPWFMPAAIGVGVLGVVGAIIFWPSKKAEQ